MPRKKKRPRSYEPPEIVGDVDALPPVQRHNKGESMYDEAIVYATENKGTWIAVDPMGRTSAAFRNGLAKRLIVLDLEEVRVAQRGNFVYLRYDGEAEDVASMIERVRKETRAQYGE